MARITRNAVVPFTATLVSRTAGAPGPIETNSTRALAVWNKKKPGIIETTAEKPSAANGRWRRLATGVTMTLTRMQAMKTPVAAFAEAIEITTQRTACASIPTTIGNGSRRHGIEKKVPNAATAHPAAITSATSGAGAAAPAAGSVAPVT